MPHLHELLGKIGNDAFCPPIKTGRHALIKRRDLGNFQWRSPFLAMPEKLPNRLIGN